MLGSFILKTPLKFVLLSAVLLACPIANAQPGGTTDVSGPGPGGNFPQGGGRYHGGQHHHSPIPNHEQVMSLPTLSPQQKQDIEGIYMQSRQTMRPLMMQLRQMGGPGPNAGGGGQGPGGGTAGGAAGDPQRADLMRQIHEERRSVWEAVKVKLTPDQISQLEEQAATVPSQFSPQ
jgi:Spy/CpxP family protein refolding chaperone